MMHCSLYYAVVIVVIGKPIHTKGPGVKKARVIAARTASRHKKELSGQQKK
ncbi:hypothetical protein [Paenibacillus sp. XY044]|uniref:hypothetical protein n=1 Tax=Paenibacillus sp. XY044 TaxID=2026089 RepID=UPI0015C5BD43|nr:hypothetical protein [Paenibacillus sp. XY044]